MCEDVYKETAVSSFLLKKRFQLINGYATAGMQTRKYLLPLRCRHCPFFLSVSGSTQPEDRHQQNWLQPQQLTACSVPHFKWHEENLHAGQLIVAAFCTIKSGDDKHRHLEVTLTSKYGQQIFLQTSLQQLQLENEILIQLVLALTNQARLPLTQTTFGITGNFGSTISAPSTILTSEKGKGMIYVLKNKGRLYRLLFVAL